MASKFFTGQHDLPDPLEQYLRETTELEFEGVERFAIDPAKVDAGDFTLPQHQVMYRFWLGHRSGDELPPSSVIDPLGHIPAVPGRNVL